MLLSSLAVLVAALPLAVLGGEFPVHNGVVGGAPADAIVDQKVSETLVEDNPVYQAGNLRYVENSGVCGGTPLRKLLSPYMLIVRQKPPLGSTQLQVTRT